MLWRGSVVNIHANIFTEKDIVLVDQLRLQVQLLIQAGIFQRIHILATL